VSPLRGEKPQNRPLSKLNAGTLRNAAGKKSLTENTFKMMNLLHFQVMTGQQRLTFTKTMADQTTFEPLNHK